MRCTMHILSSCDFIFICNPIYLIVRVGVNIKSKTIELEGIRIKLQIWDTGGHKRFQDMTTSYCRGAMVNFLSYSITPISHTFLHLSGTFHIHTCQ